MKAQCPTTCKSSSVAGMALFSDSQAVQLIRGRKPSCAEWTEAYLARIDQLEISEKFKDSLPDCRGPLAAEQLLKVLIDRDQLSIAFWESRSHRPGVQDRYGLPIWVQISGGLFTSPKHSRSLRPSTASSDRNTHPLKS